jgi:perosamine synthetase
VTDPIPLSAPDIGEDEIAAVGEVLRSGRLSLGPCLEEFEAAAAKCAGVGFAAAVNSGTSGLHLGLEALGIGAGDEVVTTPFSFVASTHAIVHAGATPVFVDIEPDSLNIDPRRIEAALTPRTRALLPVHVFGRPAQMNAIRDIAAARDLVVIEDACEAIGAEAGGRRAGGLGDVGVFAFYPNKQVTTGEGGVVVSERRELIDRVRALRNQGRNQGRSEDDWYEHGAVGWNYRLSELAAALGVVQLSRLEQILTRREAVAHAYRERLSDDPRLELPAPDPSGARTSWFVYSIRLRAPLGRTERDRVAAGLAERGIACARYFAPIHLQPAYRERLGLASGDFPVCEAAADRCLALPFFNAITVNQIDRVCETLRGLLPG